MRVSLATLYSRLGFERHARRAGSMNCPRCKAEIGPLANPDAIVTCPGCGSRLMTRSAAIRSQGGATHSQGGATQMTRPAAAPPPPAPGSDTSPGAAPQRTAVKVGQTTMSGKSTGGAVRAGRKKDDGITLEMLLKEIQAVRETQQAILDTLQALGSQQPAPAAAADAAREPGEGGSAASLAAIRAPQRKSAIVVDDDQRTRDAAVAELERADIPARAFTDANQALAAIAEQKPDVIVLEVLVGGELAGKDLVNMIKATMEWVDIPIVLWTRENVSNQREARQVHGADEVVAKSQGAAALVARVITLFRR
jgi:CheY-like chemotaxis protein